VNTQALVNVLTHSSNDIKHVELNSRHHTYIVMTRPQQLCKKKKKKEKEKVFWGPRHQKFQLRPVFIRSQLLQPLPSDLSYVANVFLIYVFYSNNDVIMHSLLPCESARLPFPLSTLPPAFLFFQDHTCSSRSTSLLAKSLLLCPLPPL